MDAPRFARDVMIRDLVTVAPGDHILDGMRKLLSHNITGAPVVDGAGNFVGMFSERCCLSVLALTAPAAEARDGASSLTAADFMVRDLVTLTEDMDAVEAIERLLSHRISGAPVVDGERFLGVFSERFSMNVLMAFVYDQVPAAVLRPFVNRDFGRVLPAEATLMDVTARFLETSYRRLEVLDGDRLLGQISRRDVLRARHHLSAVLGEPLTRVLAVSGAESVRAHELLDGPFGAGEVEEVMDRASRTITPDTSLLEVAQIFMRSDLRRLPVLDGRRLVGQLSRRDVLAAFHELLVHHPQREKALLYLSALDDPEAARARFA